MQNTITAVTDVVVIIAEKSYTHACNRYRNPAPTGRWKVVRRRGMHERPELFLEMIDLNPPRRVFAPRVSPKWVHEDKIGAYVVDQYINTPTD